MRWFFLSTLLLLAACSSNVPPPEEEALPEDDSPPIVALDAACAGAAGPLTPPIDAGTLPDGSLYEIYQPGNWNGRLMLFAHGYFDPYANGGGADDYANPILPNHYEGAEIAALYNLIVCSLVEKGFALAWSSYAVNGWAIETGYQSTQELRNLAVQLIDPDRVYVMGFSLGGQVTVTLAEKYPDSYDGALAACGPVAGSSRQLQYIGDVRTVFDYGYPGVLPGSPPLPLLSVPEPPPDWSTAPPSGVVQAIGGAILADPAKARKLADLLQLRLPYSNDAELVNSWTEALYFAVRGVNNARYLAGGNPYDNRRTSYFGLGWLEDRRLNAGVFRYTADAGAVAYYRANYESTGNLETPLLTLHTNRDPQIPFSHEALYALKVLKQRDYQDLAQQYVNRYGHCNFQPQEVINALDGLIRWVEAPVPEWLRWAVRPRSGDVTLP